MGVATGIASALWAGMHGLLATPALIPLYGLALGFHALPGVIAQQVLRLPLVALITHAIAALVSIGFVSVLVAAYLTAAVLFGGVQEGVSALTRYRHWEVWRFLLSGAITGAVLLVPMWFAFSVSSMPPWAAVGFIASCILGPVAWTCVGLSIGSALRRAGVVRRP